MIGDWVYNKNIDKPMQVYPMMFSQMFRQTPDATTEDYNIFPIPITPEILKKNGFRLDTYSEEFMSGKWWTRNDFVIHESMNDSVGRNNFSYKYVHQLQHALRLCGIEKEIEL